MKPDLYAWLSWIAWIAVLFAVMRITAVLVTDSVRPVQPKPVKTIIIPIK